MGDREVRNSLIAARIKSAHPTVRRAIVSEDDPYDPSSEHECVEHRSDIQLVSALFRPIRTETVPPITRANPAKSKSFMCCCSVIPLWGLRLRK